MPAPGFLPALAEWCREHGVLLVADEVQTGFCRTGAWFACEHEGVVPDLVATAKGIAGGMPLAGAHRPGRDHGPRPSSAASAGPTAATRWPAPPPWPPSTTMARADLAGAARPDRRGHRRPPPAPAGASSRPSATCGAGAPCRPWSSSQPGTHHPGSGRGRRHRRGLPRPGRGGADLRHVGQRHPAAAAARIDDALLAEGLDVLGGRRRRTVLDAERSRAPAAPSSFAARRPGRPTTASSRRAGARARHCSAGTSRGPGARACTHTWSAPASKWARTRSHDRVLVAPRHDGVDQPVAAAVGEVVVAEAEAAQIVLVVGQADVHRRCGPARSRGPGPGRSRAAPPARRTATDPPRALPGLHGVLGRHQVGVGAVGPLRRAGPASSGPRAARTRCTGVVGRKAV